MQTVASGSVWDVRHQVARGWYVDLNPGAAHFIGRALVSLFAPIVSALKTQCKRSELALMLYGQAMAKALEPGPRTREGKALKWLSKQAARVAPSDTPSAASGVTPNEPPTGTRSDDPSVRPPKPPLEPPKRRTTLIRPARSTPTMTPWEQELAEAARKAAVTEAARRVNTTADDAPNA